LVLLSLINCQHKGGFDAYVHMGNCVRYLKVIPVVCFIKGDAKSGDTLCCQFGGKNCKGRVPRLCLMPMKDLDDPMHDCKWIHALDLESIYKKAAQVGELKSRRWKSRSTEKHSRQRQLTFVTCAISCRCWIQSPRCHFGNANQHDTPF
jgi:hypothetical protein